jgi:hypothetical protein
MPKKPVDPQAAECMPTRGKIDDPHEPAQTIDNERDAKETIRRLRTKP